VTYITSANCLVKDAVIIIAAVAKQFAFLSKLSTTLYMEMTVVMFCDFHRAQAWYRWMRSNGSAKNSLKFLLQQVADAASYPDFIERCNSLNESPDYSEKARDWFMKHWLSHQQRWVRYWRLMVPHTPWTTNGVETLHHTLKTKFLAHYGDRSLQGFLFAVLTKYLPSMMKDYRAANLAITCARVFKGKMPDFLVKRPQRVVDHCLKRLPGTLDVKVLLKGHAHCFGKHWHSLQEQYLDHPVFKLDEEVLTMKTFLGYRKVYFSGFLQKNRTLNLQVKPKEKPKLAVPPLRKKRKSPEDFNPVISPKCGMPCQKNYFFVGGHSHADGNSKRSTPVHQSKTEINFISTNELCADLTFVSGLCMFASTIKL
ncbi:hypothetical protein CAPTEDRAFT_186969, partial [Capitella teleta]